MYTCLNPLRIWKDGVGYVDVPCGKCYDCQMRKRAEWDLRLQVEALHSEDCAFVTLTYDNDHLENLSVRTTQLWLKSLRNKGFKFRYYGVAEFGELYGRPHYHFLIFFKEHTYPLLLYNTWDKGIMDVGSVTPAAIHYVTKWHVHPKYRIGESRELHGFTQPSKKLGFDLLDSFTIENVSPVYDLNGNKLPVSRYYRKKLGYECSAPPKSHIYRYLDAHPHLQRQDYRRYLKNQFEYSKNKQKSLRYEKV